MSNVFDDIVVPCPGACGMFTITWTEKHRIILSCPECWFFESATWNRTVGSLCCATRVADWCSLSNERTSKALFRQVLRRWSWKITAGDEVVWYGGGPGLKSNKAGRFHPVGVWSLSSVCKSQSPNPFGGTRRRVCSALCCIQPAHRA